MSMGLDVIGRGRTVFVAADDRVYLTPGSGPSISIHTRPQLRAFNSSVLSRSPPPIKFAHFPRSSLKLSEYACEQTDGSAPGSGEGAGPIAYSHHHILSLIPSVTSFTPPVKKRGFCLCLYEALNPLFLTPVAPPSPPQKKTDQPMGGKKKVVKMVSANHSPVWRRVA